MTILVIGGGSIGKRHARNLLALGETEIGIVEVNEERADAVAKELGVSTYPSLESAYAEKHFEVAFICSPSIAHLDQAFFCAERGSDLFVEKPLSHTTDRLDKLLSLCAEKKLVTMVGSNWKFYPLFQKMKEYIDSGVLGRILSVRCEFGQYLPDWHPWEDYRKGYSANKKLGGGILLDSHEFDYLIWFLGSLVQKLACFSGKISNLEIDVEDTAEAILQFENGAIGEIHLDYIQRFPQRNFEFFGENGTLAWDVHAKKIWLKTKENGEQEWRLPDGYDINDMYVEEAKHFLACVRGRMETVTPMAFGAEVVRLIMAAKESSEKNQVMFL